MMVAALSTLLWEKNGNCRSILILILLLIPLRPKDKECSSPSTVRMSYGMNRHLGSATYGPKYPIKTVWGTAPTGHLLATEILPNDAAGHWSAAPDSSLINNTHSDKVNVLFVAGQVQMRSWSFVLSTPADRATKPPWNTSLSVQ